MKFRGTLILLVVCLGLVSFIYFYEIRGGEERERAKQEENRLWELNAGEIQRIDIGLPDQEISAIKTKESTWQIIVPRPLDADSNQLNQLADSAAELEYEDIVDTEAADLSRFGLNPAESFLRLHGAGGKIYAVQFGKENPTGNSTYAAIEGERTVMLIASSAARRFEKELDDLRNHSLAIFQRWEIDSVTLANNHGTFHFKKEEGDWYLGDDRKKAEWESVNTILDALGEEIVEFVEDAGDPTEYGLKSPVITVILRQGETMMVDVRFGFQTSKGVYAQVNQGSTVKIVGNDTYRKLLKKEDDFLGADTGSTNPR